MIRFTRRKHYLSSWTKIFLLASVSVLSCGSAYAVAIVGGESADMEAGFVITPGSEFCLATGLVAEKSFSFPVALSDIKADGSLASPPPIDIAFTADDLNHNNCEYHVDIGVGDGSVYLDSVSFTSDSSIQVWGPGTLSSNVVPIFNRGNLVDGLAGGAEFVVVPFKLTLRAVVKSSNSE